MTDLLVDENLDQHSPRAAWQLADGLLLRVAGQPASTVAQIRTPLSFDWAERVLDRERDRDEAAAGLLAGLEEQLARWVPGPDPAADSEARVAVINLRRDVYNRRRPKPVTRQRAATALPADLASQLDGWLDSCDEVQVAIGDGDTVLGDEVVEVRGTLRLLLADDRLRSAVLLQSEVLERNMDRYLDPRRKFDKSIRNVERSLLELLYRAALKTSPFSTLTAVALGRLSPDAPRAELAPTSFTQVASAAPNIAIAARLAAAITARPDLRGGFSVTLVPGATVQGDLVRYVRRRRTATTDPDAVVSIDGVHENLFFLPSGPALADVARLVPQARSLDDLHRRLLEADRTRETAEVDQLLGHLLRLGFLLVPDLQLDLGSPDPAATFCAALDRQRHPVLRQVASCLERVGRFVDAYPGTPVRARSGVLTAVRTEVEQAFAALGVSADHVPRTLLYEDTTLPGPAPLSRPEMERALLDPLAPLAEILPAFDLSLPRRLNTVGFFKARYGVGGRMDDLERFCHEYQRDFFEPYTGRAMRRRVVDDDNNFQRQENFFRSPVVTGLDDAREAASTYLAERCRELDPDEQEIQLGADFVEHVRARLVRPDTLRQSWSCMVQLSRSRDGGSPTCVLNSAYAGMTLMFSRFIHALDRQGARASDLLSRTLASNTPSGAVLAELRGGFETTNLNIHPLLTPFEIVCPGDVSTRAVAEQIPMSDLSLRHDPTTDRVELYSTRLECQVIPVYLGFLMPMALPEIQQVLLCFSPTGMASIDIWAGTGQALSTDRIAFYPRLRLGDLVVQRAMWKLPTRLFPVRAPQETSGQHFLRVQRWRRETRLPLRVFAQIDNAAPRSPAVDEAIDDTGRKSGRKPLPVDFESWFSVQLLEQLVLGASSRVVLTEALPGADELLVADQEGEPYVTELLVELYPKEH